MDRLDRWLQGLSLLLLWAALAAGAAMMVHVTIDVVARTFFGRPLSGANEVVASYYMVAAAFLPWAWVTRHQGHIAAELFTRNLSSRASRRLDLVVDVLTFSYLAVFVWQSIVSALRNSARGEVWEIQGGFLPIWPARWLLPIAGSAMVLCLALRILRSLLGGLPRPERTDG